MYDAENRLVEVKKNGSTIATFTFDGDGRRVKSAMGSETILFIGGHYEIANPGSGQTMSKYYFAGASRIAIRKYTIPQSMSVEYILGDHLGSTGITTDANGAKVSEMRYKPWGEVRYSWTSGLSTTPAYSLMDYTFTGQFSYMDDPSTMSVTEGFGLMFYNARMYDPALGRFTSADSIIPGGVQGYDKYAYTNNNPIRYTDPTGNSAECTYTSSICNDGPSTVTNWSGMVKDKFGVTLSGGWTAENAHRIYDSLFYMNRKFGGKLATITEGSIYSFQSDPAHYGGKTNNDNGNITFWSYNGVSPYQNIYHEIAHSLDVRTGEFFTNRLRSQKVYTDGEQFVMGGPDNWSKPPGTYSRNSFGYAEEGLDDPAFTNKVDAEQHSATTNGGNNANEEFGDLVANYVAGNFINDPNKDFYQYGLARQSWVRSAFFLYFYTQSAMP